MLKVWAGIRLEFGEKLICHHLGVLNQPCWWTCVLAGGGERRGSRQVAISSPVVFYMNWHWYAVYRLSSDFVPHCLPLEAENITAVPTSGWKNSLIINLS